MNIYSIITLCGGLAFFLFGMHVMSGSLEKVAGGKLEDILKTLTSNPGKSLMLGAVITIAIQSSSALTVMLVGLVNSGIMSLSQTVGVIMGSNVGTTLTAWILGLNGLKTDNIFLSMLKPENFSPIIALIGVIMIMGAKSAKKRDVGTIMVGFAILMFGMELMSDSVAPLADMPEFTNILTAFKNPLLGVLIGTVFTGIIQSSAASVGVLQALSLTGSITYGMAIPIIMGQNIGTCVTALLSSIGVNKNAKKVSVIHISFNLIGTIIGLIVYFIAKDLIRFDGFDNSISSFAVAGFHSVFNIATTIILIPFSKKLVDLANLVIKETGSEEKTVLLDERLLISPSIALGQCKIKTVYMAEQASKAFIDSISDFDKYDDDKKDKIKTVENELDDLEDELNAYLVRISGTDVSDVDGKKINGMLHSIVDIERISDYAMNMIILAENMHKMKINFSDAAKKEIEVLNRAVSEILVNTIDCYTEENIGLAATVEPLKSIIDKLILKMRDRHVARLRTGECSGELGVVLTDYINYCDRVAGHCSNIAINVIQSGNMIFSEHDYFKELSEKEKDEYEKNRNIYKERFALPE
ncbi:Na/Pi cotransporter family protein [Catonella morbi]|nr:Na/Pi cotransporter family protein [Catonella morbi]